MMNDMMFIWLIDIGDVLYYLFILAFFFFSTIRKWLKKQKPSSKEQPIPETRGAEPLPKETNTIEEVLKEFFPETTFEEADEKVQAPTGFETHHQSRTSTIEAQEGNTKNLTTILSEEQKENPEEKVLEEDDDSQFDIRQAVIYDAIINRPYN